MKVRFPVLVALIIFLSSCSPVQFHTETPNSAGFSEPNPETFVAIMPTVREYFYYRKQAVTANDIELFWAQYPELQNNVNIEQGINSEELTAKSYQSLNPFDGNISPEHYERIKVKVTDGQAEVLVHGMELYTYLDENNQLEESGGEFKIVLYMNMKSGRWVIYKTDEVTLGEWKDFSP